MLARAAGTVGVAMAGQTYLTLDVGALIVAVGGCTERGARLVPASDTATLRKVLLTLRLTDLNLLLFTAAAELVRLESALGLERRATVLGDVLVGHVESVNVSLGDCG